MMRAWRNSYGVLAIALTLAPAGLRGQERWDVDLVAGAEVGAVGGWVPLKAQWPAGRLGVWARPVTPEARFLDGIRLDLGVGSRVAVSVTLMHDLPRWGRFDPYATASVGSGLPLDQGRTVSVGVGSRARVRGRGVFAEARYFVAGAFQRRYATAVTAGFTVAR